MSWSEVKYAVNSTLGTDRFTSLDQVLINSFGGHQMFTENGTFVVPSGITEIYISACAAGGQGGSGSGGAAGKAGEFIMRERLTTVSGETFTITVGDGNTIIIGENGYTKTLITASVSGCAPNDILGYWTGYSGIDGYYASSEGKINVNSTTGKSGNGGAFGFGGGAGSHNYDLSGYKNYPPLGGSSIPLTQENYPNSSPLRTASLMCGGDAQLSTSRSSVGAAAGGYGAGGGGSATTSVGGKGSPGMVFIEWGGLRR